MREEEVRSRRRQKEVHLEKTLICLLRLRVILTLHTINLYEMMLSKGITVEFKELFFFLSSCYNNIAATSSIFYTLHKHRS